MADSDTSRVLSVARDWRYVFLFVVVMRLLLNVPALVGVRYLPPPDPPPQAMAWTPAWVGAWYQWDSGYYLQIARHGYSPEGNELAFFPLYALLMRWGSLGNNKLMAFAGYIISNVSFIVAALVLWKQVAEDHGDHVAWATTALLALFPTSFFFSAVYAESLFLLFAVLTYALSARKKYILAAVCVSLASVTRVTGLLLTAIPTIEILLHERESRWRKLITCGAVCGIGAGTFALYLAITQGSPFAFTWPVPHWKLFVAWPWVSFSDSLRVALYGYGGFADNWLMRLTSLSEVLVVSVFCACLVGAWFHCQKSLFVATLLQMLLQMSFHGPYTLGLWSWTRFVLPLFPCFIVLGIVYTRQKRPWWVLALSAVLLACLTAWFASGRWVA